MEDPSVILGEVIWTIRAMLECLDSRADGIHVYVLVGVNVTNPTAEVAHVEAEKGKRAAR